MKPLSTATHLCATYSDRVTYTPNKDASSNFYIIVNINNGDSVVFFKQIKTVIYFVRLQLPATTSPTAPVVQGETAGNIHCILLR